jgi:hypothetical protein
MRLLRRAAGLIMPGSLAAPLGPSFGTSGQRGGVSQALGSLKRLPVPGPGYDAQIGALAFVRKTSAFAGKK